MNDTVTPVADAVASTPTPPSTPAEASSRLAAAKADPAWTSALMAGSPKQIAEFHSLHELASKGDIYDLAIAGELAPGEIQSADHIENIGVASMLREAGIRDEIIRDVIAGTQTDTKEIYAKVKQLKDDRMSDAVWTKRLSAGDREAKRDFHLMHIVLTGNIRDEKAA